MRNICIQTPNPHKVDELKAIWQRHGVKVIQDARKGWVDAEEDPEEDRHLIELLRDGNGDKIGWVLRERSSLFDPSSGQEIEMQNIGSWHLKPAINRTVCEVFWLEGDGLTKTRHSHEVAGYIDANRLQDGGSAWEWDASFIHVGAGLSLEEMRTRNMKLSGRDLVQGELARQWVDFDTRQDSLWPPVEMGRTVDFVKPAGPLIWENPIINNPNLSRYGLDHFLKYALSLGISLRSPKNKREGIVWAPGSAPMPLVPKPDEIHESTYRFHDFSHYAIPDLTYEGEEDELSRRVYIIWRMMSEAFTLVFADMLFVDTLKKSEVAYDFGTRRIHPLFESLALDWENGDEMQNIKKLLEANVRFALRGDLSGFEKMQANPDVLNSFRIYGHFFVADLKWTARNFDAMKNRKDEFARWSESMGQLRKRKDLIKGNLTIQECISKLKDRSPELSLDELSVDELIKLMAELLFEGFMAPALKGEALQEEENSEEEQSKKAFYKYMLAQMRIFSVFDFVPESKVYENLIEAELTNRIDGLTQDDINVIRKLYEDYLQILRLKNLITDDDLSTYAEIYPLFPPYYVSYKNNDGDVAKMSDSVFRNI